MQARVAVPRAAHRAPGPPMNRKTANVQELWHRCNLDGGAQRAVDMVDAVRNEADDAWDLEDLLRYHDPEIDEDEVGPRDDLDRLLEFYGLVEIAAQAGLTPARLPQPFLNQVKHVLTNVNVRRYYRKHYPLLLPDMLLARCLGVGKP